MKNTNNLIALVSLLFCIGCASPAGPRFTKSTDATATAPPDKALVFILRKPEIVGSANTFAIGVNGNYLVTIPNGGFHSFTPPPGTLRFTTRFSSSLFGINAPTVFSKDNEMLKMDVEAGKVYYIRLRNTGSLTSLPPEQGKKDVAKCKKVVAEEASSSSKMQR